MGRWPAAVRAALLTIILGGGGTLWVAAQTPPPATSRPASPVIARVNGVPLTQEEFDSVARPYFAQLRQQLGDGFTEEMQKIANRNVLDELIKRVILARESQSVALTEADTDRILRADPFFRTNGKVDEVKFLQYKTAPGSNYRQVLPQVQALARMAKLDESLRRRFTPTTAQLRTEFSKRSEQIRFTFLPLLVRDVPVDGVEATEDEMRAYYAAHPDQFQRAAKVRYTYLSLPLPPRGDSLRATTEELRVHDAEAIADSLRAGVPLETLARRWGGTTDSGLMDSPPAQIPALGRVPELLAAFARADSDTTIRVIGPGRTENAVVVGLITERQPRTLPPFAQVVGEAKRRADLEKKRTTQEKERADYYAQNRGRFQQPRVTVTRIVLPHDAVSAKAPKASAVDAWFAAHQSEYAGATLTDSLRTTIATRLTAEARAAEAGKRMVKVVDAWRKGKAVPALAQSVKGHAETVSWSKPAADSLFPAPLVDSLLVAVTAMPGAVAGPRAFGASTVVWHVDEIDTTYVAPYEQAASRVGQLLLEEKRRTDEDEARAYYDAHKSQYKTKPKFVVDYIAVQIPPADSVPIPEAETRAYYDKHLADYKQDERVRARHILIKPDPSLGAAADARAHALADSLLDLLRSGADFADLARRWSQDPGSGRNGGDLGFFARGQMVQEFNDTAFALAPGQISQLTKTQFGYHIIKSEEHQQAGTKPYADVRTDIRFQLASARGDSLARKSARDIQRALARGGNAEALAVPHDGVKTSAAFAAVDPVPGLGFVQGLAADIATLPLAKWGTTVYKENTHYVLVRPTQRVPEQQAEFLEVKTQATTDAQNAKKRELLNARITSVREKLRAGAPLDSVAAPLGGLKDSGPLSRQNGFVPFLGAEQRLIDKAFALKKGQVSDTLAVAAGFVILRLEDRATVGGTTFEKDRASLSQELLNQRYDEWLQAKKKGYRIEILRPDLREAAAPSRAQVAAPTRSGR